MKKRHLSKTNWFGTAVLVLGMVQSELPKVSELLGKYDGVAYIFIGVAIIVLRELTKEPVK